MPRSLLISEELDEILALSDRVAVMYEGRIVGLFDAADAEVGEIGLLMTGGGSEPEPGSDGRRDDRDATPAATAAPVELRAPSRSGWSAASTCRAGWPGDDRRSDRRGAPAQRR